MIRVGIGGWSYEPWRETFYPKDVPAAKELEYASRQVTAIEINSTFYRTQSAASFKWTGEDFFSIEGITKGLKVAKILTVKVTGPGKVQVFEAVCRIDTPVELEYYRHGGILQYVLRQLLK